MTDGPICWLASYPKSGNTWVRFLIAQYLFGRVESSAEIAASIPDVHIRNGSLAGQTVGGTLIAKTHHRLNAVLPHADRAIGAIYIARHPASVLFSSLNYLRLIAPSAIVDHINPVTYARNFIRLGGDPLHIQHGFGSMLEHAGSWMSHPTLPRLVVRYEDLRERPEVELSRMLHFLGAEPDSERVRAAIADSTFERMKQLEIDEKSRGVSTVVFAGSPDRAQNGVRFMNAGTSGRSLDEFEPGLQAQAEERFSWYLQRFGYERQSTSSARSVV